VKSEHNCVVMSLRFGRQQVGVTDEQLKISSKCQARRSLLYKVVQLMLDWKCSQMTSLSTKFSKFSWGGMPPDPPTWAANAALSAFGGASAPPLQNYFLRL